jgi:hypothetical protein
MPLLEQGLSWLKAGYYSPDHPVMMEHLGQLRALVRDAAQTQPSKALPQIRARLAQLQDDAASLKAVADYPRLMADGIIRTSVYTQSPLSLTKKQQALGWGEPPVADVVVIGGGPAGIASAYYAGRLGLRTVLFEAGYLAQAFSDANAQSVKEMRTNAKLSSLAQARIVPDEILKELDMAVLAPQHNWRAIGRMARHEIEQFKGHKLFDNPFPPLPQGQPEPPFDPAVPVARNELFQYLDYVADQAAAFPSVQLCEKAPIQDVRCLEPRGKEWVEIRSRAEAKNPDAVVYELISAKGHRQLTRNLVIATGFVGEECQYTKIPPQLSDLALRLPGNYLMLKTDADLVESFQELEGVKARGAKSRQLILSETLLGKCDVQHYLASLPAETRLAVIGGGESGAKGALEILSQNPKLKVDLFVSEPLTPAQAQIPPKNTMPGTIIECLKDPALARQTIDEWQKQFKTPITPKTFINLLKAQQAGQVRVFELGAYFSPENIRLETVEQYVPNATGKQVVTRIYANNPDILKNLKAQREQWDQHGIAAGAALIKKDSNLLAEINGPLVSAAGYDRTTLRKQGIMGLMLQKGLIQVTPHGRTAEIELSKSDGLTSVTDPNIGVVGGSNYAAACDSALFGTGVRAYFLVNQLAHGLQEKSRRGEWDSADRVRLDMLPPLKLLQEMVVPENPKPPLSAIDRLLEKERLGYALTNEEDLMLARFRMLRSRL